MALKIKVHEAAKKLTTLWQSKKPDKKFIAKSQNGMSSFIIEAIYTPFTNQWMFGAHVYVGAGRKISLDSSLFDGTPIREYTLTDKDGNGSEIPDTAEAMAHAIIDQNKELLTKCYNA